MAVTRTISRPYGERWAAWRVWLGRLLALVVGVGSLVAGAARGDAFELVVGGILLGTVTIELAVSAWRTRH